MQKLKNALAFLCVTFVLSIPATAQFDFRKGFIVNLKGDTLHGFVKDQTFDKLSKQAVFKPSRKSKTITYLPGEIRTFGFNDGDIFESFEIEYCTAPAKDEGRPVKLNRFLNQVIAGEITLYELTTDEQPLFIKKEGGALELLCIREVLVSVVYDKKGNIETPKPGAKYWNEKGERLKERSGQYFEISKDYVETLKEAMADCNRVRVEDALLLKAKAIANLVLAYNKHCAPESYQRFIASQRKAPIGRFSIYSSSPTPYLADFGGIGGGAMLELGGETFSANFGAEFVLGSKNAEVYNYKLFIATLRLNYRPFKANRFSPYVFSGISMNATSRNVEIEDFKQKHFIDFELGLGADYMLSERFFLKGEVAYPHFPNVRLGVGMMIH